MAKNYASTDIHDITACSNKDGRSVLRATRIEQCSCSVSVVSWNENDHQFDNALNEVQINEASAELGISSTTGYPSTEQPSSPPNDSVEQFWGDVVLTESPLILAAAASACPSNRAKRRRRNTEEAKQKSVQSGRWTDAEHELFLNGLAVYGREWKKVAVHIPTRTSTQCRSHAQKFFSKIELDGLQPQQEKQSQHPVAEQQRSVRNEGQPQPAIENQSPIVKEQKEHTISIEPTITETTQTIPCRQPKFEIQPLICVDKPLIDIETHCHEAPIAVESMRADQTVDIGVATDDADDCNIHHCQEQNDREKVASLLICLKQQSSRMSSDLPTMCNEKNLSHPTCFSSAKVASSSQRAFAPSSTLSSFPSSSSCRNNKRIRSLCGWDYFEKPYYAERRREDVEKCDASRKPVDQSSIKESYEMVLSEFQESVLRACDRLIELQQQYSQELEIENHKID